MTISSGRIRPRERWETFDQQKNLLNYVKNSEVFHIYLPLLQVMIGTGLRCGELIGLTWKDVDLKTRTVYVNHQLIYKNYGDGCDFHVTMPKTEAGIREIPKWWQKPLRPRDG